MHGGFGFASWRSRAAVAAIASVHLTMTGRPGRPSSTSSRSATVAAMLSPTSLWPASTATSTELSRSSTAGGRVLGRISIPFGWVCDSRRAEEGSPIPNSATGTPAPRPHAGPIATTVEKDKILKSPGRGRNPMIGGLRPMFLRGLASSCLCREARHAGPTGHLVYYRYMTARHT